MLYSGENGNDTSFRGKTWRLTNGYTRACNYKGQQCTFKNQNEALRFSVKDKPAEQKPLNEAFSLDDLEAMSTPGLRKMLASWEKRAKQSPHNQPIWDNIEAIKDALQFKRSIGETNRINEDAKAMAVGRVLVKNGFKLNWKKNGVISWSKGKQFSAHGTTEVHVSNTSSEWTVYIGSSGRSGAAVGRGQGDADLTRWLSKNKIPEGVNEAKFAPGDKVEVSGGSGVDSYARGTVIPTNKVKTDGRGIPTNIRGAYQVPNWKKEVPIQLDGGDIIVMFNNRVSKVNEAMGSNKQVTVYAKDRKTVLGQVSKQSSSVAASKVAGGAVQQERVNGYLSWVLKEGLKRQQTRYRPELSRREMDKLVKNLKSQGYKATASGPNLKTDATDKAIEMAEGVVEGELQPGKRVPLRKPLKDMPDRKVGQDEGVNEGPQPHGLVGGKKVTTIRDINHKKSGKVIPAGTSFEMKFSTTEPMVGYINYEGHWMRTQLQRSHKSFRGIGKPPSMKQLQNMDSAGIAKSVTGKRVDLDGHGPDGAPSWLLAMGLI